MAAYRFGHSSCNSGLFPFKIGLKYAHLQGLYCSYFNQLQPVFFGSVLLGFCGFFISESENCSCWLQKNWLQSSFFTGFFWLLQPDFETLAGGRHRCQGGNGDGASGCGCGGCGGCGGDGGDMVMRRGDASGGGCAMVVTSKW